jgi:hypothetical protein
MVPHDEVVRQIAGVDLSRSNGWRLRALSPGARRQPVSDSRRDLRIECGLFGAISVSQLFDESGRYGGIGPGRLPGGGISHTRLGE